MACAANYAWVNRSSMTFLCRQVRLGQGGQQEGLGSGRLGWQSRYNIYVLA